MAGTPVGQHRDSARKSLVDTAELGRVAERIPHPGLQDRSVRSAILQFACSPVRSARKSLT